MLNHGWTLLILLLSTKSSTTENKSENTIENANKTEHCFWVVITQKHIVRTRKCGRRPFCSCFHERPRNMLKKIFICFAVWSCLFLRHISLESNFKLKLLSLWVKNWVISSFWYRYGFVLRGQHWRWRVLYGNSLESTNNPICSSFI